MTLDNIVNDKDIIYGLEEWIEGKRKLLSIMGISGSGKTYMAKKLSKKYNAKFIELDLLFLELRKIYGEDKIGFKRNPKFTSEKFIEHIEKESVGFERVIIEGIHLRTIDINYICKGSVIIKDTDLHLATERAYKRQDDKERQNIFGNNFMNRSEWLMKNMLGQKQVDLFRINVERIFK